MIQVRERLMWIVPEVNLKQFPAANRKRKTLTNQVILFAVIKD